MEEEILLLLKAVPRRIQGRLQKLWNNNPPQASSLDWKAKQDILFLFKRMPTKVQGEDKRASQRTKAKAQSKNGKTERKTERIAAFVFVFLFGFLIVFLEIATMQKLLFSMLIVAFVLLSGCVQQQGNGMQGDETVKGLATELANRIEEALNEEYVKYIDVSGVVVNPEVVTIDYISSEAGSDASQYGQMRQVIELTVGFLEEKNLAPQLLKFKATHFLTNDLFTLEIGFDEANKFTKLEYGFEEWREKANILRENEGAVVVSQVIDGDTIVLTDGNSVRLIGINAPEAGHNCYQEATNELKDLVLGKQVRLEEGIEDKDPYGRLLRYVYVEGLFVNLEMVREGYAATYAYGENTEHDAEFALAQEQSQETHTGCMWPTPTSSYIEDKCFSISASHFDAAGNDNYNLNDEYVQFKNNCSYAIEMTGWSVKDTTSRADHIYTFPYFTLSSAARVTLRTGQGTNTTTNLYWGRTPGEYAAIWNNTGDTVYLRNSKGELVLSYSYENN